MTSANDKLIAARLMAASKSPYLRAALWSLVSKMAPGLGESIGMPGGTFAVTADGILMLDPKALESWSVEGIAAALEHEVWHILRRHHDRCKTADPMVGNLAKDAEINDDLIAAGRKLPVDPVTPTVIGEMIGKHVPDGLTAEEYLALLNQRPPSGGGGKDGECRCGSGAGNPVPGEPKPGKDGKPVGRSEAELNRVRKQTAEEIRKHAEGKGRGTIPDGILRWADDMTAPPKIRWQDRLARVLRNAVAIKAGAIDFRYDRPARRQIGGGIVLPRMISPVPVVAVGVDTSGSMSPAELAEALRETSGILKAIGSEATFIACDAAVHAIRKVRTWRDVAAALKGGGGTYMAPMVAAAERLKPRPNVLVILTDGMIGDPGPEPAGIATIWCLLGGQTTPCASWGTTIIVDRDEQN